MSSRLLNIFLGQMRTIKHALLKEHYEQQQNQKFYERHGFVKEILKVDFEVSDFKSSRINLFLPSVKKSEIFGGASTAINFFQKLEKYYGNARIIADSEVDAEALEGFPGYTHISSEDDSDSPKQIISIKRSSNTSDPCKIFVAPNDLFISTLWNTAQLSQKIVSWQSNTYRSKVKPFVYLIQDYEPGFYAWSSQYLLARNTYEYKGPVVAVFNSRFLMNYFYDNGYHFEKSFVFEPQMSNELLDLRNGLKTKIKQILVYGRPSSPRNAFDLIIEALRVWSKEYPKASEWKVLSAGEKHPDIPLNNQVVIKSVGKLSMENYAYTLNESSIGISMMISPHPSYPPLEMAHYGLWVITNNYDNKDLSKCHENIVSLSDISPENIAKNLINACQKVEQNPSGAWEGRSYMESYLSSSSPFDFVEDVFYELNASVFNS